MSEKNIRCVQGDLECLAPSLESLQIWAGETEILLVHPGLTTATEENTSVAKNRESQAADVQPAKIRPNKVERARGAMWLTSEHCPRLTTLLLNPSDSILQLSDVNLLPRSLTTIDFGFWRRWSPEILKHLPSSLINLDVSLNRLVEPEEAEALPEGLVHLGLYGEGNLMWQELAKKLPRGLRSLGATVTDMATFSLLPRALSAITFSQAHHLRVEDAIEVLGGFSAVETLDLEDSAMKVTSALLLALPRTLTTLTISGACYDQLPLPGFVGVLPPLPVAGGPRRGLLQFLRPQHKQPLPFTYAQPTNPASSASAIDLTTSSTSLDQASDIPTPIFPKDWPQSLTSITVSAVNVSPSFFQNLPPSLTFLRCTRVDIESAGDAEDDEGWTSGSSYSYSDDGSDGDWDEDGEDGEEEEEKEYDDEEAEEADESSMDVDLEDLEGSAQSSRQKPHFVNWSPASKSSSTRKAASLARWHAIFSSLEVERMPHLRTLLLGRINLPVTFQSTSTTGDQQKHRREELMSRMETTTQQKKQKKLSAEAKIPPSVWNLRLQQLSLSGNLPLAPNFWATLPRNLNSLTCHTHGRQLPEMPSMKDLPPFLQTLHLPSLHLSTRASSLTDECFQYLPRSLTKIHIETLNCPLLAKHFSALPPDLISLILKVQGAHIIEPECVSALPKTLEVLSLSSTWICTWPVSTLDRLPKTLTNLRLTCSQWANYARSGKDKTWRKSFSHWSIIELNPKKGERRRIKVPDYIH